jgi:squalene-associated FAD-dependent desaturase
MSAGDDASPRIAIIGGGLAGLAAAVGLADRGLHVELFEARRQLGGRTGAFRDAETGMLVDHCQHVSLGCCTNFDDFCKRTGLINLLKRFRTLHFVGPNNERCDVGASRWLPAPLHLLPSLLRLKYLTFSERVGIIRALQKLAKSKPFGAADVETIGGWLRRNGQTNRALELFWTPIIVSALSESIDRASVLAVRKVCVDAFMGGRTACEMSVPSVPLAEFYGERLERCLADHHVIVRRECAIKQIHIAANGSIEVELPENCREGFDAVILATTWRRVGNLLTDADRAALPELNGVDRFESAPISAVHLWFDRPFIDVPHAVLPGRLSQWVFDRGNNYVQVVISASRDLAQQSRESIVAEVVRDLGEIWPEAKSAKLNQSRIVTEQHAVFSPLPGVDALRPTQKTSRPNLFLAGDWTATGWPATMESAVRSGYLAAEAVLDKFERSADVLVPDSPRPWLVRQLIG